MASVNPRPLTWLLGPALTILALVGLEVVSYVGYQTPAPGAIMAVSVVFAAFLGGTVPGLVSAGLIVAYLFLYGAAYGHGRVLATPDTFGRAVVIATTSAAMALLVGELKRRSERAGRRRLQSVEEQSQQRFAMLFESAPVGILINRDGRVLHANAALLAMFGYDSADALVGRSFENLVAPQARDLVMDRSRRREAGEAVPTTYESVGLRRDGGEFPYVVHAVRLAFPDGPATVAFLTDISERKAAEAAVHQLNRDLGRRVQDLQALLDVLPVGVVLSSDAECAHLTANGYIRRLLGIGDGIENVSTTGPNADRLPFVMLRDGRPVPRGQMPMHRTARLGEPVVGEELEVVGNGGMRTTLLVNTAPLRDEAGRVRGAVGSFVDVGPLKRVQDALREREANTEFSLRSARVGSWQLDLRTLELTCSDTCKANFGRAPGEPFGYGEFQRAIHPDDLPRVRAAVESAVATRGAYEAEYRAAWPDGSEHRIVARGRPTYADDGTPLRMAGITIDVTDRRHAEEALRVSQERLAFTVRGAGIGMWYCDLPFDRLVWNDECKAHFGLPPDAEVTIDTFYERMHPDDRARTRRAIERSIAERAVYDVDYRTVAPDGTVRWIRATGRAFFDAAGKPVRFDGITTDLTERKAVEQELRYQLDLIDTITSHAGESLFLLDRDGRTTFVNPAAERTFGYAAEDLLGKVLHDVLHHTRPDGSHFPIHECPLGEVFRSGTFAVDHEDHFVHRDGHFVPVLCSNTPIIKEGAAVGAVLVVHDMTARHRAEEERRRLLAAEQRARREAEEARAVAEQANAAKDQFLAVLSHELRTPLTPVLSTVQSMEAEPGLTEDVRDALAVVRRNVELEARLIDDLLDLTRISKGKLRLDLATVDAHDLLRQALGICAPDLRRKRLELAIDLRATRHHVRADPARLQQVYWNLISNAVKFTPEGGRVTVRSCDGAGGALNVEVVDTGIGFGPDVVPRMFSAFEQGDAAVTRRFGGLGLGLTISRSLVEMHGGTLTAASDGAGRGARFVVSLAAVAADAPAAPDVAPSLNGGADGRGDPLRILLVDDHEDTNRAMRRLLQRLGHDVRCAHSVRSALEAAEAGDGFDLLISDIGLPDGTGHELMRHLLARDPSKPLKAIALSGFGMEEDVRRSREAGFHEHLTKPVSFQRLEAAIRELAAERG